MDPKEHAWRDYLYDHVREDLKDRVNNKLYSLVFNYVKSHMYGFILSVLLVVTGTYGVVKSFSNDYVKEVNEKPNIIIVQDLDLYSELVLDLYEIIDNKVDVILLNNEGFYLNKFVDYNSFSNNTKLSSVLRFKYVERNNYTFTSCEDLKFYDEIYNLCISDTNNFLYELGNVDNTTLINYDINSFEIEYKNLWGSDKELPKEDFQFREFLKCNYSSYKNDYMCYYNRLNSPNWVYEYKKLVKAIQIGESIYLYNYYVYANLNEGKIYKDRTMTELIIDKDFASEDIGDEEMNSIIELGQIYKHTYRKNENGTYYYVSSEPVNSLN